MVQLDVTSPTVAGLGGAGGAAFGLQAYRARDLAMEAEKAQMAENAKRTEIAQAHLAQGQAQFERTQQFRERLAAQHEAAIDRSRGSAQTQARMMLDAAMGAEGTTPSPATPEDSSPLAPEFRVQWRKLREAIDAKQIDGEDAVQAVKFLAESHATALTKHHANDLSQRIHNAQAAGAFTIDENQDGEPDPEVDQIPDRWLAELKDGSTDPRVVEKEFADLQQQISKHKVRLADRVKSSALWTQRIDEGRTTQTISQANAAQMATVLQQLHNGAFEDKSTGFDDYERFQLHINAAQSGQVVVKMPWGETAMDPKALAVMAAMRAQLALTGSRAAPKAAPAAPAYDDKLEKAASEYANDLNPDNAHTSRDRGKWKADRADYLRTHGGAANPDDVHATEPQGVPLPPGDPTAPADTQAGLEARVNKLSPEDRARYQRRVQELLQGQP